MPFAANDEPPDLVSYLEGLDDLVSWTATMSRCCLENPQENIYTLADLSRYLQSGVSNISDDSSSEEVTEDCQNQELPSILPEEFSRIFVVLDDKHRDADIASNIGEVLANRLQELKKHNLKLPENIEVFVVASNGYNVASMIANKIFDKELEVNLKAYGLSGKIMVNPDEGSEVFGLGGVRRCAIEGRDYSCVFVNDSINRAGQMSTEDAGKQTAENIIEFAACEQLGEDIMRYMEVEKLDKHLRGSCGISEGLYQDSDGSLFCGSLAGLILHDIKALSDSSEITASNLCLYLKNGFRQHFRHRLTELAGDGKTDLYSYYDSFFGMLGNSGRVVCGWQCSIADMLSGAVKPKIGAEISDHSDIFSNQTKRLQSIFNLLSDSIIALDNIDDREGSLLAADFNARLKHESDIASAYHGNLLSELKDIMSKSAEITTLSKRIENILNESEAKELEFHNEYEGARRNLEGARTHYEENKNRYFKVSGAYIDKNKKLENTDGVEELDNINEKSKNAKELFDQAGDRAAKSRGTLEKFMSSYSKTITNYEKIFSFIEKLAKNSGFLLGAIKLTGAELFKGHKEIVPVAIDSYRKLMLIEAYGNLADLIERQGKVYSMSEKLSELVNFYKESKRTYAMSKRKYLEERGVDELTDDEKRLIANKKGGGDCKANPGLISLREQYHLRKEARSGIHEYREKLKRLEELSREYMTMYKSERHRIKCLKGDRSFDENKVSCEISRLIISTIFLGVKNNPAIDKNNIPSLLQYGCSFETLAEATNTGNAPSPAQFACR